MQEPTVEVERLSKVYRVYRSPWDRLREALLRRPRHRAFSALQDVNFSLPQGQGLAILGENGAGKSTLLKILAGISTPTSGRLSVRGKIASILELGSGFHPEFTGRQNIVLNAAMLGLGERELQQKLPTIIEWSELGDFIDQPVKVYSTGMAMRLGFSIATQVEPDVLIIDEALSVGDGYFQKKCMDRLLQFVGGGGTLLFCSHAMYYASAFCQQALWLRNGRVEALGPVADVVRDYETFLLHKSARGTAAGDAAGTSPAVGRDQGRAGAAAGKAGVGGAGEAPAGDGDSAAAGGRGTGAGKEEEEPALEAVRRPARLLGARVLGGAAAAPGQQAGAAAATGGTAPATAAGGAVTAADGATTASAGAASVAGGAISAAGGAAPTTDGATTASAGSDSPAGGSASSAGGATMASGGAVVLGQEIGAGFAAAGGAPPRFAPGDRWELEIEWESASPDVAFHVGVGINRSDDLEVCTLATHLDGRPPMSGSTHYQVRVVLPRLPLVKGDFTLYLFLLDESGLHIYDQRIHRRAFTVQAPGYAFGLITADHAWVESAPGAAAPVPAAAPLTAAAMPVATVDASASAADNALVASATADPAPLAATADASLPPTTAAAAVPGATGQRAAASVAAVVSGESAAAPAVTGRRR
jgi:ABC-type polysaccharide/polyol phosphate transport system ATPase subunit